LTTAVENIRLHQEVASQKTYQEAIVTNVPSGIVGVDREGNVLICNNSAHAILGIEKNGIIGMPVERLGSPVADALRRTLSSGKPLSRGELSLQPGQKPVGISTNPIVSREKTEGAVAVFQDLSAIKRLEEKEREVERNGYLNTLASRLSHELKNPLVAIKTFSQMLPAKFDDPEFRTSFSNIMQEEIEKINSIIEKINKLAETQRFTANEFDFADFLHTIRLSYEATNDKPPVSFHITDEQQYTVTGDPLRLNEALGYLINFCRERGGKTPVTVTASDDGPSVRVEVSGAGNGTVPHDELLASFAPELRGTVSIGVILSKKIFEAHGGTFTVDSENGGVRFTTRIPLKTNGKNPGR